MNEQNEYSSRRDRTIRKLLLVLWLCFVIRGLFYCAALPIWEGYDEPSHFAFIQFATWHRALPLANTPVSREVEASLHLLPLSWEQRLHVIPPPIYTEDSYWQLTPVARQAMEEQARNLPKEWQTQLATSPAMYEAQQAPLYYWLMSIPVRLVDHWTLASRVMLVRTLSMLLGSLIVPIAYATASRVLSTPSEAIGVVAVIVCMPELMVDICRVGNDSISVTLFSLLTLILVLAVRPNESRWFIPAGAVLGLGLLSKAYFLLAIPAFVMTTIYAAARKQPGRLQTIRNGAAGLVLGMIICIGWYYRNLVITRSLSGEQDDVTAAHAGLLYKLAAALHVKWVGGVTSVLVSHVWFGGWSFLKLPKPVYAVFACGIALAALGVVRLLVSDRIRSGSIFVLATMYGLFWAGLLYNMLVIFVATGVSSSSGWYLYAAVVPEILLVTLGLNSLLPPGWRAAFLPTMAIALAAIDLWGSYFLLLPYYTGFIVHTTGNDVVHPAHVTQLIANAGPIIQRLTANKPSSFTPAAMTAMLLLYTGATIASARLSFGTKLPEPD